MVIPAFFQRGARYMGNEKGSGLGLILTKDFIQILGGTIKVESALDKGTSVYLYFNN